MELSSLARRVKSKLNRMRGARMGTKSQADVGKDFDKYVDNWAKEGYELEVKPTDDALIGREKHEEVKRPGDEWGLQRDLRDVYTQIFAKFASERTNILEIGSGAGRLTEVMVEDHASRIGEYHTLDPSVNMTNQLKDRVKASSVKFQHHIGGSSVLAKLPKGHFGLAYSQSCWSHVNLYDQYLYLRDLRQVMTDGGVFIVNGIFMIGGNLDWCFDRFKRRVYQMEHSVDGVYHEVTGTSVILELALRLGWEVVVVCPQAFMLRAADRSTIFDKWAEVPASRKQVPFARNLPDFFEGKTVVKSVSFI